MNHTYTNEQIEISNENANIRAYKEIAKLFSACSGPRIVVVGLGEQNKPARALAKKGSATRAKEVNAAKTRKSAVAATKKNRLTTPKKSKQVSLRGASASTSNAATANKNQTLCWSCTNAHGMGCSWFRRGNKPVPGWIAEETLIMPTRGPDGKQRRVKSFCVKSCPEYEKGRVNRRIL